MNVETLKSPEKSAECRENVEKCREKCRENVEKKTVKKFSTYFIRLIINANVEKCRECREKTTL